MKSAVVLSRAAGHSIHARVAFSIFSMFLLFPATQAKADVRTGDLYALIVGVSNYRNPTVTQLKVSDKDARDFARFLEGQRGLFKGVNVKLLTNEQATKAEVENNLYYWLRRSGKDDTVLLFFSGHGADDPYHPDRFYFVAHDSDPRNLQGTAVNMAGLEFLKPLDSKRIVLIADTCHAGGYSMQGTKRIEPSLERFLSQFRESQGHVIITSCKPNELSRESPNLGNSVFTHFLLEGLAGKADSNSDGVVTLKEAYEYVYEKAKDATNGIQHPQFEGRFSGQFPISLTSFGQRQPEAQLEHRALPVLLSFTNDKCPPCRYMKPIIEDVALAYSGRVSVVRINVDHNKKEVRKHGIIKHPAQVFLLNDGREFFRNEGTLERHQVIQVFAKMGLPVPEQGMPKDEVETALRFIRKWKR